MDEKLRKAIIDSVQESCMMFLPSGVSPQKPISGQEGDEEHDGNVVASIGFDGAMNGTVCLSAPMNVALALSAALSGDHYEVFEGDARDGFGEIANMMIGAMSTRLSSDVGTIDITPPDILTGNDHREKFKNRPCILRQVFNSASGPFAIAVLRA